MNTTKKQLIKLFVISIFAVVPYAETNASVTNDHSIINLNDELVELIAVRIRPDAEVKASPVRASVRRDNRQESYEESTEESASEQSSEPTQQEDRGRSGGIS